MVHLQETKRKDEDDGELSTRVHLQLPHKENRQDAESPICNCRHSSMCVCDIDDGLLAQTVALAVFVLTPNKADGSTLEQEEKEIHGAKEHDDSEGEVDDSNLVQFTRETEVEHSNRGFGDSCCQNIKKFTDESVLWSVSHRH
jgi:hypothetical protein